MVGQEKLLEQLSTYSINTFPKASLFIGPRGSGRKTIITNFAEKLYIPVIDVTVLLEAAKAKNKSCIETFREILQQAKESCLYRMYIINLSSELVNKDIQTALLKVLEETPERMFLVLLAESEVDIAPAVLNRCIQFRMAQYTEDQLRTFYQTNNSFIYKIYNTPGKLVSINEAIIDKLYTIATLLATKPLTTKYFEFFNLSTLVNCDQRYDYCEFELFFELVKQAAFDKYKQVDDYRYLNLYLFTVKFQQNLFDKVNKVGVKNLLKEHFLISYLTNLYEEVMKWNSHN